MEIWHNPRCSKSRAALALLTEHGAEPTVRRYLDDPPTRDELERALAALGTEDPLAITRTGEPAFGSRVSPGPTGTPCSTRWPPSRS